MLPKLFSSIRYGPSGLHHRGRRRAYLDLAKAGQRVRKKRESLQNSGLGFRLCVGVRTIQDVCDMRVIIEIPNGLISCIFWSEHGPEA